MKISTKSKKVYIFILFVEISLCFSGIFFEAKIVEYKLLKSFGFFVSTQLLSLTSYQRYHWILNTTGNLKKEADLQKISKVLLFEIN